MTLREHWEFYLKAHKETPEMKDAFFAGAVAAMRSVITPGGSISSVLEEVSTAVLEDVQERP